MSASTSQTGIEEVAAFKVSTLRRLWRYYQAGIVNTIFGYGLFSALVALGLNIYVAQIIAHVCGVTFNYFTYSRYAFSDLQGSQKRFVLSYVFNYFLGLGSLWAASRSVTSPYVAGLISIIFVSLVNFAVLKRFVYREAQA